MRREAEDRQDRPRARRELRVVAKRSCEHCGSARHPSEAHTSIRQALEAVKRAMRGQRYGEAEMLLDVARKLVNEGAPIR